MQESIHPEVDQGDMPGGRPTRIAVIMSMIAPYTTPMFERITQREDCELLVVYETPMERDRRWKPQTHLPYDHVVLKSWTLDLSWLAVGAGVKTRFDTYLHVPKHPLDALLRFRPDAVVAAGGGIWSSPANIAALWARRRTGWALIPWWGSFRRPRPTLPRRISEPWVRIFIRSADAWMGYGRRSERDLVRLGADPARTVVAPIVPRVPAGAAAGLAAGRTREDPLRFLFVGRLIERKGVDVLISAFEQLKRGELWIAGDGPLRSTLEKAAGSDPRVRFFGHLEEQALSELYSGVDVLVVPSWYEPWGLVVHEALAYAVPVIATDQVGATEDLVKAGVNGLIVPAGSPGHLAEAMRRVTTWNALDWKRNAECSREKLANWTIERAADAFVQACRLGIRHRSGRASRDRS